MSGVQCELKIWTFFFIVFIFVWEDHLMDLE
jgi:hypothetical protein